MLLVLEVISQGDYALVGVCIPSPACGVEVLAGQARG
jgi:hypothetical protein